MRERYHSADITNIKFLVTGGAGFIGSNLVEYLLDFSAKVTVLDDLSTGFYKNIRPFESNGNFTFIEGDIRDINICQSACAGVDYVLHQAALGSVPRSINDPAKTNSVNIDGFLNVLIAARDQKVKRFIYAASSSTYGDSQALPKVEENIGKPLSPYAITKYVNELYADVFHKTYGIDCIGLRYFNVFGPKQDPKGAYAAVVPLFIDAILNNTSPTIHGDGLQTRDFTYIENVIQMNMKALFSESKESLNQVYNTAVGDKTTVIDLFNALKKHVGSTLTPTFVESRKGDVHDSLANISKAKKYLGYEPVVKIEEGLTKTLDWFRANEDFIKTRD